MFRSQPVSDKLMDIIEKRRTETPAQKKKREKAFQKREKQRLKEWAKYLDDDYDGDWASIIYLLEYKLGRVRDYLDARKELSPMAPVHVKNIQKVQDLLKKAVNEENFQGPIDAVNKKWGKSVQYDYKDLPDGGCSYSVRREKENEKNQEQVSKEYRAAYLESERLQKECLAEAFKLMVEHIWEWWH